MALAQVGNWTAGQFNSSTGGQLTGRTSTAGNLIVVAAFSSSTSTTITDDKSNTYTQWTAGWVNDGSAYFGSIFFKENCLGGASHHIILTSPASQFSVACATEYSGAALSSSKDKEATGTGTSTNLLSAATATLAQAAELCVGLGCIESGANTAFTAGSLYTIRTSITDGTLGGLGFLEDKIVAATTAVTASATHAVSNNWMCGVCTFKEAAAAAGVVTGSEFVRQAVTRASVR